MIILFIYRSLLNMTGTSDYWLITNLSSSFTMFTTRAMVNFPLVTMNNSKTFLYLRCFALILGIKKNKDQKLYLK